MRMDEEREGGSVLLDVVGIEMGLGLAWVVG